MRSCLAGFVLILANAQQPPDELVLLGKIRARVVENLKRLPDYTCAETIERSHRFAKSKKFAVIDTIHLEVAYIGGKELFGWPGAGQIGESDIDKLVSGTVGNGTFALVLKGVFLTPTPTFEYIGDTELAGRPATRYDYRVRSPFSGYLVRTDFGEALVAYHGSIWVDRSTLDLRRMDLSADDIPPRLQLASVTQAMEYGRAAIGNSDFLLAQSSELNMTSPDGSVNRNRTSFHACRQFTGQSVIKFDVPAPEPTATPVPFANAEVVLPDEFTAYLGLETTNDSDSAAVGDPVHATLRENIKSNRATVVPKGADLAGRISFLQKRGRYYLAAFQFTSIAFDGGHASLTGRENSVNVMLPSNGRVYNPQPVSDSGPQAFRVDRLKLLRGSRLVLRSRLLKFKDNDSVRP